MIEQTWQPVTIDMTPTDRAYTVRLANQTHSYEFEIIDYRVTEFWEHMLQFFGVEPEPGWVRVDDLPGDMQNDLDQFLTDQEGQP